MFLIDVLIKKFITVGRFEMEQDTSKFQQHEDTKKLSFVIVFLSLFVIALFGLAPLALA